MNDRAFLSPVRMAVMLAVAVVTMALLGTLAVGGSYVLTLHTLHVSQAASSANAERTCLALRKLDEAKQGIVFPKVNAEHPSEQALTRIFTGLHDVYMATNCESLLKK